MHESVGSFLGVILEGNFLGHILGSFWGFIFGVILGLRCCVAKILSRNLIVFARNRCVIQMAGRLLQMVGVATPNGRVATPIGEAATPNSLTLSAVRSTSCLVLFIRAMACNVHVYSAGNWRHSKTHFVGP